MSFRKYCTDACPAMWGRPLHDLLAVCRMVKIEHSVFALPFAYTGAFLAAGGWPGWKPFLLLTVAMVAIRSFAMGFNRLADLSFDRVNPRTKQRPLVTGELSRSFTALFLIACVAIFVGACYLLNPLCLKLSPVAVVLSAYYSLTKRYSWRCHYWLGSVLGLSPLAGWISVSPAITLPAVIFSLGVLFWVAGFDIMYSCQDVEFDRRLELHSTPVHFGLPTALTLSTFCHVVAALLFLLGGWAAGLGWIYAGFAAFVGIVLLLEHQVISPDDLTDINTAFFTMNGAVSVLLFVGVLADLFF